MSALVVSYPIANEKYPKLNAWISRLEELPYFKKENAVGLHSFIQDQIAKNAAAQKK